MEDIETIKSSLNGVLLVLQLITTIFAVLFSSGLNKLIYTIIAEFFVIYGVNYGLTGFLTTKELIFLGVIFVGFLINLIFSD